LHGRLHRHGLDGLNTIDHLHEKGVVFRPTIEAFAQAGPDDGGDQHGKDGIARQRTDYHQGQQGAVGEHDGKKDHGKKAIEHYSKRGASEELSDAVQLTRPYHRVPGPASLEVCQGQAQNMSEQLCAQADVDAVRRVGEEIGAQATEQCFKATQGQHADGQHVQCGDALVHQDFVCDDLKEQGRQQRKELQEERR
jgi:hypothetical protein